MKILHIREPVPGAHLVNGLIRVPEQLSVVGIDDDTNLAGVSRVPLTTFPHPKEVLGKKVAENMLAMVENPQFDGNWLFETEAVLRDSVQRLQE